MKTVEFNVDELIKSDSIHFGDSEDMILHRAECDLLTDEEYQCLTATMNAPETKQIVLDWKLDECTDDFIESIASEGIVNPVAMVNNVVVNGHHRLAVAKEIGMAVPVAIYDSWQEFDEKHVWNLDGTMDHCDMKRG